jgi:hypothetical protein
MFLRHEKELTVCGLCGPLLLLFNYRTTQQADKPLLKHQHIKALPPPKSSGLQA